MTNDCQIIAANGETQDRNTMCHHGYDQGADINCRVPFSFLLFSFDPLPCCSARQAWVELTSEQIGSDPEQWAFPSSWGISVSFLLSSFSNLRFPPLYFSYLHGWTASTPHAIALVTTTLAAMMGIIRRAMSRTASWAFTCRDAAQGTKLHLDGSEDARTVWIEGVQLTDLSCCGGKEKQSLISRDVSHITPLSFFEHS